MRGLVLRIIGQMKNDKRTLALIFAAPVLLLGLLYLLLGESTYIPKIMVTPGFPDSVFSELEKQDVKLQILDDETDVDHMLKDKKTDAVVTMDQAGMHIRMLEAGNTKAVMVTSTLKSAAGAINTAGGMEITYLYGEEDSAAFDSLGYVLLGVLSFFFVFIIAGISFVRERETGTLERLMATPVRRYEVVLGYTLGLGVFAVLQGVLITLFTKYVLGMEFEGSVLLVIFVMVLLAFAAVSMGAFVSIFANNEFQVMQFIPIVIIPQIFFSGLIPIDTFPYGLGGLAYIMPVYYGCTGLENVLVKGFGFSEISGYLFMLLLFNMLFFMLNVFALKKYRRV